MLQQRRAEIPFDAVGEDDGDFIVGVGFGYLAGGPDVCAGGDAILPMRKQRKTSGTCSF